MKSSCEVPAPDASCLPIGSRVLRFLPPKDAATPFAWEGVASTAYKDAAVHHCGVLRKALAGTTGEQTSFHVRYFEIAPGGFSSRERHQHEHVVMVLRGQGEVELGNLVKPLRFGDVVYVAPNEVHQFRNLAGAEPLGFLCIVDAQRDRPVLAEGPVA